MTRPRVRRSFHHRLNKAVVQVDAIEVSSHQVGEGQPGGDIYIHIRVGWKALTVTGAIIAQAVVTLISERNLFF